MPETILVIAEQQAGRLNRVSLETVAAARSVAATTGWAVEVAVLGDHIGSAAQELAQAGAARGYALESPQLAVYTADAYIAALQPWLTAKQPKLILLPHTYQVRDFAPRLALALNTTLIADVTGFVFDGNRPLFTRQMFQGKFAADVAFSDAARPWIVTLQSGAFRADAENSAPAPVETVAVEIPEAAIRVHPHEVFREAKQAVDLSQSEVIVAVGRGIKEQKNLEVAEKLAAALGADIAASRPICDAGWLPLERQIGSSGQSVAPKLYVALGISGAIQHIVGMKGARTILAINKDAEAPIFEIADIGAVADLFEVVPALTDEIQKLKANA
jgi:electron transfer flavoprotein alpha subunit